MTGDQLRGLVRAVEGSVRHVYGVGERPRAEMSGELGALAGVPGHGHTPVWLTAQGRLVTEEPAPQARPSPRDALRWVGEPAGWGGDGAIVRARAAASRTLRSARTLRAEPAPSAPPAGEPAAWLVPEGSDTVPLYEAVHPVTGDQLLSTDSGEAQALGYSDNRLMGHLVAAAPVTGVLGLRTVDLAWTRRERGHPAPIRGWGAIEQPEPGAAVSREAFFVRGLALFPPEPVVRVEIELDGEPAGRARIGLPRADHLLWQQSGSAQTTVSTFEFPVTGRLVHPLASEVRVDAVAVRADGRRFVVPGWTVELEAPQPAPGDPEGRLAGLRERTAELVAAAQPPPHEGLKVLAFAHRLDLGGAQRYFFELLTRLAAAPGFACTVVCPDTGPYTAAIEALGIPVHLSPGLGPGDPEAYEGRLLELAAWAAPQGFDLVWANTFDAYPGADLAARLGLPSVWSLHESFDLAHWWAAMYGTEAAHPYARMRAEESLRGAGALVFAADATRRQYEPHADPERMHTFPYGMELEAIDRYRDEVDPAAARERLGLPQDATVVLCLGTLEPRKGQAVLAQAFGAIAARHPDAILAIVGDLGGEYSTGLHAYLDRAGLGDQVRVEPLATDPYAWHVAADVFALASDIESSPIVVLEAMAFGTPVVATAVFGVPELIEDGTHGYLCEASDIDSLGTALERALDDPARDEVGRAGEHRVRERHDPDRYAERMSALMAGLVEGGAPAPRRRPAPAVSVLIPTLNAGRGLRELARGASRPGGARAPRDPRGRLGLGRRHGLPGRAGRGPGAGRRRRRVQPRRRAQPARCRGRGRGAGDNRPGRHADQRDRAARAGRGARGRPRPGRRVGHPAARPGRRPVQPLERVAALPAPRRGATPSTTSARRSAPRPGSSCASASWSSARTWTSPGGRRRQAGGSPCPSGCGSPTTTIAPPATRSPARPSIACSGACSRTASSATPWRRRGSTRCWRRCPPSWAGCRPRRTRRCPRTVRCRRLGTCAG